MNRNSLFASTFQIAGLLLTGSAILNAQFATPVHKPDISFTLIKESKRENAGPLIRILMKDSKLANPVVLSRSLSPTVTDDAWIRGNGTWGVGANWSTGVPTSMSDVYITVAPSAVTLNTAGAAYNLSISSLNSVYINDGNALTISGTSISNAGTIALQSDGDKTALAIGGSNVTLGGGGVVTMGDNANNFISAVAAGNELTNQETIEGSGSIGSGGMVLANSGTIDANQPVALTIQASGGVTNTGTLEATNAGILGFSGTTVTNTNGTINTSGGTISATSTNITGGTLIMAGGELASGTISGAKVTEEGASTLQLSNASLINGTLSNSAQLETLGYSFNNEIGGTVTNAAGARIQIDDYSALTLLAGTYSNAGTIALSSSGDKTELIIGASNITLGGGGIISMSNNANNFIFGLSTADMLTNQETIEGAGSVGDGAMTLVNSGTIDANQPTALTIAANGGTTNSGTLEATNNGTLGFSGTTVTNSGTINTSAGIISAANTNINGGTVKLAGGELQTSTISGATVTVAGSSNLQLSNGSLINGTLSNSAELETLGYSFGNAVGGTVTNASGARIQLDDYSALTLQPGTYSNAGTIAMNASGDKTELIIGASNITLGGGGIVSMSNDPENLIFGLSTADTLTNQETIEGAGSVGNGQMTLVNSGTIDANQPIALTIAANGGTTNTGTLEATNNGTLGFSGTTVTNTSGTINTSAGKISAVTTNINGGTVTLAGGELQGTTISGAKVTVAGSSDLQLSNGSLINGTLSNSAEMETLGYSFGNTVGGTVTNATGSRIQLDDYSALTLQAGTYSNAGTIALNSSGDKTELIIGASSITLGGGGVISMSNNANNFIYGLSTADTLTNQETIQGAGNIGDGQMTLVNSGTIDANQPTALTIAANGGTTNTGTLEATNSGTLGFSGTTVTNTSGTINTSAGTISALNATIDGGTVTVAGGELNTSTISGAKVTVSGSSDLQLSNGLLINGTLSNSAELEMLGYSFGNAVGGTVTNAAGARIQLDDYSALTLQPGTYSNAGTIALNSSGDKTELIIGASNVTLGGGGVVSMSDNVNNFIFGSSTADTLTNQETIEGAGNIGDGQMTLVNSGTIDANQPASLTIAANGGTTNSGTLEATNGGTLGFSGTTVANSGTINTSAGTISALNASINGGTVTLAGGELNTSTISGAKLTVAGSSNLQLSNASLINGTLSNSAEMEVLGYSFNNAIGGTVTNAAGGRIQIDDYSALTLQSGTYSNAGTIALNSSGDKTELIIGASNVTLGGGGVVSMSNNANNFIFGSATGDTLTNQETIQGAGNIGDGQMTLVNAGTIYANQPTALIIDANGGFSNSGTLSVATGSTLQITTSTPFSNFASNTLTGGTYNVAGILQFGLSGTSLVTNAANITLTGTTSQIEDVAGNNVLKNFATNASSGVFALQGGRNFTTAGNFTNNGTLSVASGSTFAVDGNLTNFSAGTLAGGTYNVGGTLQFNGANIVTNAANINLNSTASKITDQTGTFNALSNFASNASAGVFALSGGKTLTVAGSFTNAGQLTVGSGSTFSLSNGGTYTQTGGISTVDGTLSSSVSTAPLKLNAGSIYGTGTLGFSVVNAGTLTPANSLSATSLLNVTGTYTQNSTGVLDIAIAGTTPGTKYDQLKVTGAATVGGTLNLSLDGGYVPALGTTFDILSGSSVSGSFTTVNGAINGSEHFSVSCTAGNCDATVVSGAALKNSSIAGNYYSSHLALSAPTTVSTPAVYMRAPLTVPYSLPKITPLSVPNFGRQYRGIEAGVDVLSLVRVSRKGFWKELKNSSDSTPVGFVATMHY